MTESEQHQEDPGPRQTLRLVPFWKEGRVVHYRIAGDFSAQLPDDFVLIVAWLVPRLGEDGPR